MTQLDPTTVRTYEDGVRDSIKALKAGWAKANLICEMMPAQASVHARDVQRGEHIQAQRKGGENG